MPFSHELDFYPHRVRSRAQNEGRSLGSHPGSTSWMALDEFLTLWAAGSSLVKQSSERFPAFKLWQDSSGRRRPVGANLVSVSAQQL